MEKVVKEESYEAVLVICYTKWYCSRSAFDQKWEGGVGPGVKNG